MGAHFLRLLWITHCMIGKKKKFPPIPIPNPWCIRTRNSAEFSWSNSKDLVPNQSWNCFSWRCHPLFDTATILLTLQSKAGVYCHPMLLISVYSDTSWFTEELRETLVRQTFLFVTVCASRWWYMTVSLLITQKQHAAPIIWATRILMLYAYMSLWQPELGIKTR